MDFGATGPLRPEINLTPLVDVVLLLLIFFMISTSFVVQPGINIKLPQAKTSDSYEADVTRLTMTAAGLVFVGDEKVEWEGLPKALARERERSQRGVLVIKADESVKHGSVVRVMDAARQVGFERIAIATTPYVPKGD
ncbi:MAG: biopolymer transporter ExbD [Candidatus Coatesbacteria bacterium]|nr:biopolymer transporter ExbD [Candidatus Coatesbacteria bacterium]